jgi:hypothetical protein
MFVQFDEFDYEQRSIVEVIAVEENLDEHVLRTFEIDIGVSSHLLSPFSNNNDFNG